MGELVTLLLIVQSYYDMMTVKHHMMVIKIDFV